MTTTTSNIEFGRCCAPASRQLVIGDRLKGFLEGHRTEGARRREASRGPALVEVVATDGLHIDLEGRVVGQLFKGHRLTGDIVEADSVGRAKSHILHIPSRGVIIHPFHRSGAVGKGLCRQAFNRRTSGDGFHSDIIKIPITTTVVIVQNSGTVTRALIVGKGDCVRIQWISGFNMETLYFDKLLAFHHADYHRVNNLAVGIPISEEE